MPSPPLPQPPQSAARPFAHYIDEHRSRLTPRRNVAQYVSLALYHRAPTTSYPHGVDQTEHASGLRSQVVNILPLLRELQPRKPSTSAPSGSSHHAEYEAITVEPPSRSSVTQHDPQRPMSISAYRLLAATMADASSLILD